MVNRNTFSFSRLAGQFSGVIALLCLALLFIPPAWAQEVSASVDRTEINRGDTVTLRIRVTGTRGRGRQPDLSPLQEDFEIWNSTTSQRATVVNGQTDSWTEFELRLYPRGEGEHVIPSLQIAGQTTDPITVNVSAPATAQAGEEAQRDQEIYLETSLNKDSVYVQEQVLFTVRLFYTIKGIRNPQFTDVDPDNAVVQMIGSPNQYEQLIDGVQHGVYEMRYVIFPQQSGEIEIPDIVFRGEVVEGGSANVFHNPPTRPVNAFSDGYAIEVREKPTIFPGLTWLPARNVTVQESWSDDITSLQVGDEITRTITMRAEGLDGAVLPPLEHPRTDRLNSYPEPPRIERTFVNGSIVGTRVETTTYVAAREGGLVIPEISLPWWNVEEDSLEVATVPATALTVSPVPPPNASADEANVDASAEGADPQSLLGTADDNLSGSPARPIWVIALMALFAAVVLYLYYRYLTLGTTSLPWLLPQRGEAETDPRREHHRRAHSAEPAFEQEEAAFKQVAQAVREGNLHALRLSLIHWGRHYFADATLHNLDEVARCTGEVEIIACCTELQRALYGRDSSQERQEAARNAERLLALLSDLRQRRKKARREERKEASYALAPLYRSGQE